MHSVGIVSPRTALPSLSARAEASRINGAKSRGPKTEAGKARSSQNALRHGMRAQRHVVLPEQNAAEFEAFAAALVADLRPRGPLQTLLADRIAAAAWRLLRSDRIEAEIFEQERFGDRHDLGLALIRDCNGAGAFQTLLRYRGAAQAEFWRALRTLKALQAERAEREETPNRMGEVEPASVVPVEPKRFREDTPVASALDEGAGGTALLEIPNEPESRADPRSHGPWRRVDEAEERPVASRPAADGLAGALTQAALPADREG